MSYLDKLNLSFQRTGKMRKEKNRAKCPYRPYVVMRIMKFHKATKTEYRLKIITKYLQF